jgi:hypothetical protein
MNRRTARCTRESAIALIAMPVAVAVVMAAGWIVTEGGTARADDSVGGGQVRLSVSDSSILEGDGGRRAARVTIGLSAPLDDDLMVSYRTTDAGAAAANDYKSVERTTRLRAGKTSKLVSVPILGDRVPEPAHETFVVEVVSTDDPAVVLYRPKGSVTIVDDDGENDGTNAVRGGSVFVSEGDSGTTVVPMMLALAAPLATDLMVTVTTHDASATATADYRPIDRTVRIKAGRTLRYVNVVVHGDTDYEGDEAIVVELATDNPAVGGLAGRIVIRDDDPSPVPGAPLDAAAVLVTGAQYHLSWAPPLDNGGAPVIDYQVTPRINGTLGATATTGGALSSSVTCFIGDTCLWEIRAVNVAGAGPALVSPTVHRPIDIILPPICKPSCPSKG